MTHHEEDLTPGRDALALCFIDGGWQEMSRQEMERMPDEWQGSMARLINEFLTTQKNGQ